MGGRFLLRIEDIDPARCRPEFETAIYEDLAWLGIAWEEPVRRQSGHLDAYQRGADEAGGGGAGLSELRKPRRDRAICRAAFARAVAARSGRRAALSGALQEAWPGGAEAPHGERALRAPPRHERRAGAHRRAHLGRDRRRSEAGPRDPDGGAGEMGRRGARPQGHADELSSLRRGGRRRCRASPTWCAGRTSIRRPACIACCRRCSDCRRRSIITTG